MSILSKRNAGTPVPEEEGVPVPEEKPVPENQDKGEQGEEKAPEKEPAPVTTQLVSLQVYIQANRLPNDQLRGFGQWAKAKHGTARMSIPEWEALRQTYSNRPIR